MAGGRRMHFTEVTTTHVKVPGNELADRLAAQGMHGAQSMQEAGLEEAEEILAGIAGGAPIRRSNNDAASAASGLLQETDNPHENDSCSHENDSCYTNSLLPNQTPQSTPHRTTSTPLSLVSCSDLNRLSVNQETRPRHGEG